MDDMGVKSMAELNAKTAANSKIVGFGAETGMEVACPFCGNPNWCKYTILECQSVMAQEHVCKHCYRGAKAIFTRHPGGVFFEMVQTSGPNPPDWFEPKMRRVDAADTAQGGASGQATGPAGATGGD